jgi:hypothetical protein
MISVPTSAPSLKIDVDCGEHRRLPTQAKKNGKWWSGEYFFICAQTGKAGLIARLFQFSRVAEKNCGSFRSTDRSMETLCFGCTRNNRVCRPYPI